METGSGWGSGANAGTLPFYPTRLIGRERDIRLARQRPLRPDARLALLTVIQQFAAERPAASGEAEETGRPYAAYYDALAEDSEARLAGQTYAAFAAQFRSYLVQTTETLNGAARDAFTPDLALLDGLLRTLRVEQRPVQP